MNRTPKNNEDLLELLIGTYAKIDEMRDELSAVVGSICGGGILSDMADDLTYAIEYFVKFPEGMTDAGDKEDYFFDILDDEELSVEEKAYAILNGTD